MHTTAERLRVRAKSLSNDDLLSEYTETVSRYAGELARTGGAGDDTADRVLAELGILRYQLEQRLNRGTPPF